jgi:peptide/nickel transport system permease protein
MQRYIMIRLGQSVLTLLAVSIIIFLLVRLSGSPLDLLPEEMQEFGIRETYERQWGLDEPLQVQYWLFMKNMAKGEFGPSFRWEGSSAGGLIMDRMPATLELGVATFLFSLCIGVPFGVISALKKGSVFDTLGKTLALSGLAIPTFWLAIVLIWIFAVELKWTPTSGKGGFDHIILPLIAGGTSGIASWLRLTRTAMLDALDSEYVMYARMKGLPEWKVIWKHAFRNALIIPLTSFGAVLAGIISGSVVLETIFAWPGVGLLAIESINGRDYVVIQAITMIGAVALVLSNLLVDILYVYIDPRIRYETSN